MTTEIKSSIGVKSSGEDINWRYLNEERMDDPIITALMKESNNIFIKNSILKLDNSFESPKLYIIEFNKFLKDKKLKFAFEFSENDKCSISTCTNKSKSKDKIKKLSKKEQILHSIKENNMKDMIEIFLKSLNIIDNMPISNKNNITSFFIVIYWGIYLMSNKKKILAHHII